MSAGTDRAPSPPAPSTGTQPPLSQWAPPESGVRHALVSGPAAARCLQQPSKTKPSSPAPVTTNPISPPADRTLGPSDDPDRLLPRHLAVLYAIGVLDLTPGALIDSFVANAPPYFRAEFFEFLGTSLSATETPTTDVLDLLRAFWTWRFDTLHSSRADLTELAGFGRWLSSGKFDAAWSLDSLNRLLEAGGTVEPDFMVAEELARLPNEHIDQVVRGMALLIESPTTGSHYRHLDAPGVHELLGAGVYYGSAPREAAYHRDGHVFVVGGANSAGQAALYLTEFAAHVTLVVRAESLAQGMSTYLVERCESHPRITVRSNAKVVRALGAERLETVHIDVSGQIEIMDADALFILIGGVPTSGRVDWVRRDDAGFFLTGPDVVTDGGRGTWWKLDREPMFLESSAPGIFFAGDVRHGSIKRVASAVGEGAMAVQHVHRFLADNARPA